MQIGKYSMAILGWQHLDGLMKWVDVAYIQLAQAALIKKQNPTQPVYIYTSFGWVHACNTLHAAPSVPTLGAHRPHINPPTHPHVNTWAHARARPQRLCSSVVEGVAEVHANSPP